jgi:hypothetical protein
VAFEANVQCVPGAVAGDATPQAHFLYLYGENIWRLATNGGAWVQQSKATAGQPTAVAFSGVVKVIAGAQVYPGWVMADSQGRAVQAGAGSFAAGVALTSGAAGDVISVLLEPTWMPVHQKELAGEVVETSTLSGGARAAAEMNGPIVCTTSLAGNLSAESALDGEVTEATALTGALSCVCNIKGIVRAYAALGGELSVEAALKGILSEASALTGTLSANLPLAGAVGETSTLSGDLTNDEGGG